jgi:CheY-like chemotaxis protein
VADVQHAVDGQDAWEKLLTSERPFDCILTDIWMPKMDGKELVSRIRADNRFAGVPVYAITADVEEKKLFTEHKFTGTLLKPLTIDTLSGLFH